MSKTHGLSKLPEYRHWKAMRHRCNCPTSDCYESYGGRGITVCERWDAFENFFIDMGTKPSPQHTIERKDVNGAYEPENCYWATRREQARNKRGVLTFTKDGETRSLAEWCEIFDRDYNVVSSRIKQSYWPMDKALLTPTKYTYQRYLEQTKK